MPRAARLPLLLLPFAALTATLPLLLHGISCGQDMPFHLQSWLDAAAQLRHGHYPQWAYSPAWNAGEPRFVFYPPLSWLLGALLTSIFPISAAPIAYIVIALAASGLAIYRLACHYVSSSAAMLAAAFYIANPYMLFCAFERTAFAELLAAAWIPLLLLAVLRERPTVRGIAVTMALLWLTNAPAAVMGCYAFALLATLRVLIAITKSLSSRPKRSEVERPADPPRHTPLRLIATYLAATALGLALPAFYLVPAAYQRRYVQVAMAIIPNMRVQDNFLFTATADAAHNAVNHTASILALTVLLLTAFILAINSVILSGARSAEPKDPEAVRPAPTAQPFPTPKNLSSRPEALSEAERAQWRDPQLLVSLTLLTLLIAYLLTPLSTSIWLHLPNLQYLQFPWRLLTILSAVLAFALALLIDRITTKLGAPFMTQPHRGISGIAAVSVVLVLPLTLSFTAYHLYAQHCDHPSLPTSIAALFRTGHGAPPTDEYSPTSADNDLLRTDNPAFWFAPSDNPNAPAPNTTPTAAELNPSIATDDIPIPDSQTLSTAAPHHLVFNPPGNGFLVLNLRNYRGWDVAISDKCSLSLHHDMIARNDGLIAVPVYCASAHTLNIAWHRTFDQQIGLAITLFALVVLLLISASHLRSLFRPEYPFPTHRIASRRIIS